MTTEAGAPGPVPRFSFVVAVYNVEQYLPEFLASLERLDIAADDLELIFVDDGSVDDSVRLLQAWRPASRFPSLLLQQDNGGPGSARNAGLLVARGVWVSFPDPDDVLSSGYLSTVAAFVSGPRSGAAAMVAGRPVQFREHPSRPIAPHPLDFKYAHPEQLVDLEESPRYVHLHTITGFYRTAWIRAHALRFDEAVRPIFEDAVFNIDYLLAAPRPTIAFLGGATYYYRKRSDKSSLTSSAWSDPAVYERLPEKGYLAILARAPQPVPTWIQNVVFYDLQWFFRADSRPRSESGALPATTLDRFHRLVRQIVAYLDESTLLQFHAIDIPVRIRLALIALKTGRIPDQNAYVTKLDYAQQIMLISYFSATPHPEEQIRADGRLIPPVHQKTTGVCYFQRPWLYVRDLWVPSLRPVSLDVDGRRMPIVYGPPAAALFETSPGEVWERFAHRQPPRPTPGAPAGMPRPPARRSSWSVVSGSRTARLTGRLARAAIWSARLGLDPWVPGLNPEQARRSHDFAQAVRRRAASAAVRRRYGDAWVLIDRDISAQDNAESFYRYLRREQPQVNAWFALARSSPDWPRLAADGFRLIDYGSTEHALALRNATYLISSQVDDYILRPGRTALYGPQRWKFVFLQHGVIHNDLSRWLNTRPIRLMITTTEAEHRSIVGDQTPYVFSAKEVERTGLPRHDDLLAKASQQAAGARRTVLVAPTWRDHLLRPQTGGHRRELAVDLAGTAYLHAWRSLLAAPQLAALAAEHRLDLVFLPHPHLQSHISGADLPAGVRLASMSEGDIQLEIASARVLITDYSSMAFDAAYLGTPVVYYHFDADEFFSGRHTVRPGAFSYVDHGFGPVVRECGDVLVAVRRLLCTDSPLLDQYRQRMESTLTLRDGRCSERVYEAIRRRELPFSPPSGI